MNHSDIERASGRRGKGGEESAGVFQTHRPRFLRFLRQRVDDPATAEDLLHDATLRALRDRNLRPIKKGDEEGVFSVAWAYRILRNVLVDYYRKRDAARRAGERVVTDSDVQQETPPGETKTICRCVNAAAAALTDDQAWWVGQIDVEGRSVADASRERGLSPGAGRVRLHRARVALRRRVEAACGRCAEDGCADCTCRASET